MVLLTIISFIIVLAIGFGLGFFVHRNMSNNAKEQVEKKITKIKK